MSMFWNKQIVILLMVGITCLHSFADENLLSNGDLEASTQGSDKPDAWTLKPQQGSTWQVQEANHYLRLRCVMPDTMHLVYRQIRLKPEEAGQYLRLAFKYRCLDLKPGKKHWNDGRILFNFKNKDGKVLSPRPKQPRFQGTHPQWQTQIAQMVVPKDATILEIMPALFKVSSGTLELDDLNLQWIDKPVKDQSAGEFPIDGGKPFADMLKVQGNQLVTQNGKVVRLAGVNIPSLEWTKNGQHLFRSIAISINQWHANVIRLPVHTKFWFGSSGKQKDDGKAYRQTVDNAIQAIASRGAYVVLDLHEYRAIQSKHIQFWLNAAKRYKNHPAVLFGLLNEPNRLTWEVWRDGGDVQQITKSADGVVDENNLNNQTFHSPGMQACLNAVRSIGAKNICVIGGLDWAYDLSGILNGYAINDPDGNGVLYDTHVYPWKSDWQGKFLDAAAKYPVLLGEVGADNKRKHFVSEDRQEDPYTWNPDILGCIQKYKLHWTGWSFHPKVMAMIEDWNYKPTPYWGVMVKQALQGKSFTMKKMR